MNREVNKVKILNRVLWPASVIVLMAAFIWLSGCGGAEEQEAVPVVRPVKTLVVGSTFSGERTFPGTVQAKERVNLSFRVSGSLVELPVREGMRVKRGQLLGRIDPRDFQIALDEAKASFKKSESDYKRYQKLYEQEAVPLADLELRRAQRDVAQARMDEAQANLDYTYLKAPFAGTVGDRLVENFEEVTAKQAVVTLHDASTVEIVIDVPEQIMASIRQSNLSVETFASFEAAPDMKYPLELREASTTADPKTRTYRVTMMMPQPEEIDVLPGMTANVIAHTTLTETEEAKVRYVIPAGAVATADDGSMFVWVVNPQDRTVHSQEIEVGSVAGQGGIVVESGINSGDRIVVAGVSHLREGEEVRPMND
jgi:RND family efflux transporter MFP subunit